MPADLLACRLSAEKSTDMFIGIPLYAIFVLFCFSITAFHIYSLYLIFVNLINICFCVFLLESCKGFSVLSVLVCYSFPMLGKFSTISKYILIPILFFSWGTYSPNSAVFNTVSGFSESVLNYLRSFFLHFAPQQLFPPFYLPIHLSIFLSQLFCN